MQEFKSHNEAKAVGDALTHAVLTRYPLTGIAVSIYTHTTGYVVGFKVKNSSVSNKIARLLISRGCIVCLTK